jgi:hypothetical protein
VRIEEHMGKTTQSRKHTVGMAGEFLVAGELLRRGIMAAVTYGNAKKADVVAFQETRSALIEVKSTSEPRWVLGGTLPHETISLWILVFLPVNLVESPKYFILTSGELRKAVLPRHESYMARYEKTHGKPFEGKGVVSVQAREIGDEHFGAWWKVSRALGI